MSCVPDLQADDICTAAEDLLHDGLFPVLPVQSPGRAVTVELACGVLIAQYIVAHHREQRCNRDKTVIASLYVPSLTIPTKMILSSMASTSSEKSHVYAKNCKTFRSEQQCRTKF